MVNLCRISSTHVVYRCIGLWIMKSLLLKPLFLVISLGYLLFYFLKQIDFPMLPFIRFYWADFCCLFLVNTIALAIIREVKQDKQIELSVPQLIFSFVICVLVFEILLPRTNINHTADFWDAIAYLIGLLLFYFWRKQDANQSVG